MTYALFLCLFVFHNVLFNYLLISRTGPKTERLTILRAATHETELGDHYFCLSWSHYTDTDPTSRERAATARIEPGTSSPARSRALYRLSYRAPRDVRTVDNQEEKGHDTERRKAILCIGWTMSSEWGL